MSDLFATVEPAPPVLAEVITLHPDGVFVRVENRTTEAGTPIEFYWVERRRGTRSMTAVVYDIDELKQLHAAIGRVLGAP